MIFATVAHEAAAHPSTFQEIADGLIVVLISGLATYAAKNFGTIKEVKNAIAGRPATDLEMHPPPGLMEQTTENTNAVLAMTVRQTQANGTMKDIQKVQIEQAEAQSKILSRLDDLHAMVANVVETGATVKLDLDTEKTKVATIAGESQAALLAAIHQPDHEEGT